MSSGISLASKIAWKIVGELSLANCPRTSGLTGTFLQPINLNSESAINFVRSSIEFL